jgi:hypothetical protein
VRPFIDSLFATKKYFISGGVMIHELHMKKKDGAKLDFEKMYDKLVFFAANFENKRLFH